MKTLFKQILLAYAQRHELQYTESTIQAEYQRWYFNGQADIANAAFTYVESMLAVAPQDATHIRFSHGMTYFHKIEIQTYNLGKWQESEIGLGQHADFITIDDINKMLGA